ncbi:hypothetical protein MAPG_06120 [Magnaporthiopsis poae ATCC 64411]|uniref:Prion-inhibition and propagation HeLo domain-containing protein n=1 Tax=Magnaporthiopsis poae (strain ATCC 64411 / 73-15) TaxID=644358 RepID=A0A0C4E170_MAGP6|nr:hypothetical protein MAPG_06120 [Magnaporthiopsis poae ATCC 64411]
MDPGTYLSIAGMAFHSAVFAVKAFRKGLNFSRDAERLVLRLEVERFRLQMWGENCGLATAPTAKTASDGGGGEDAEETAKERDDGSVAARKQQQEQQARLLPRLVPLCDILRHQLDEIAALFREHEALSDRYGLEPTTEEPTRSGKLVELVARMQRSFRRSRQKESEDADEEEPDMDEDDNDDTVTKDAAAAEPGRMRRKTSTWNKIRWSILDLAKFEALVAELAAHVTRLNQLLAESSFHHPARPGPDANDVRVSIVVVGSAVDRESIDLVRSAVADASSASASALLRSGIERKAISADLPRPTASSLPPPPTASVAAGSLRLADFALPEGFSRLPRFLAEKKNGNGSALFLFERKDFDRDVSLDDKRRLTERIRRLVMLLGGPRDPAFLTPRAEGCIHDAEHYCWWLVFRFSEEDQQQQQQQQKPSTLALHHDNHQPISLRLLLDPKTKFRPPLEQRYVLASALAGTLSELYRSSWLHKGIRSDNILFRPCTSGSSSTAPILPDLPLPPDFFRTPLVCGFDYSRHESEWATIDRARRSPDVAAALYRHPAYQGAAAQGYRLRYDLYSLGLVLLEVALWAPLSNFLEGRPARGGGGGKTNGTTTTPTTTTTTTTTTTLSKDMKTFHEPHARLLRRHVLKHVDAELAFRVGSPYHAAVKFCLGEADGDSDDKSGDGTADVTAVDDPWSVPSAAANPALEFYDRVVVPLARLANTAASA